MIIQKQDKKKLYINIAILVVVLAIIAYFVFPMVFSSSSSGTEKDSLAGEANSSIIITKKYKNLKKIKTDIFDDDRYKALKPPASFDYNQPKKGNLKPFSPK